MTSNGSVPGDPNPPCSMTSLNLPLAYTYIEYAMCITNGDGVSLTPDFASCCNSSYHQQAMVLDHCYQSCQIGAVNETLNGTQIQSATATLINCMERYDTMNNYTHHFGNQTSNQTESPLGVACFNAYNSAPVSAGSALSAPSFTIYASSFLLLLFAWKSFY